MLLTGFSLRGIKGTQVKYLSCHWPLGAHRHYQPTVALLTANKQPGVFILGMQVIITVKVLSDPFVLMKCFNVKIRSVRSTQYVFSYEFAFRVFTELESFFLSGFSCRRSTGQRASPGTTLTTATTVAASTSSARNPQLCSTCWTRSASTPPAAQSIL